MLRLATAVGTATTVVALGAAAAMAGTAVPHGPAVKVKWSGAKGPIAQVRTNASPALTSISFPGSRTTHTLLVWKGWQTNLGLYYKYSKNKSLSKWTAKKAIDGGVATTDHRPSAASYISASIHQTIVVWQGSGSSERVWYSIGVARRNGDVAWGPEAIIPGAATSNGPTVFKALHSNRLIVTWKAATTDAIEYLIGLPKAGGIHWGSVQTLPHAAATSNSPTVAEASTSRHGGRLYVFWKGTVLGRPFYEWTRDPLASHPSWSPEVGFPSDRATSAAPVAAAVGRNQHYPLLVAYVGKTTTGILYLTLARSGALGTQEIVPSTRSTQGPALSGTMLAATSASGDGRVFYNTRP